MPGEAQRVADVRPCVRFDVSLFDPEQARLAAEGRASNLRDAITFRIAGKEVTGPPSMHISGGPRHAPTVWTACSASIWALLENGHLSADDLPAPPGPGTLPMTVRYRDSQGGSYEHTWPLRIKYRGTQAPPEASRVRQVYGLMEEVRRQVRDFGDFDYDPAGDALRIFLAGKAEQQAVEQAIARVFTGQNMPTGGVRFIRPGHAPAEVEGWYRKAQNAVWPVGNILSSDYSERINRIVFGVRAEFSAWRARRAMEAAGVPQEIVVFEAARGRRLDYPPVLKQTPGGVAISLVPELISRSRRILQLDVVLTNTTDQTRTIEHNGFFYENVLVFDGSGSEVWAKLRGEVMLAPLGRTELDPRERLVRRTWWDLRDIDGFDLPPGGYLARGTIEVRDQVRDAGPGAGFILLATEPLTIELGD